MNAGQPESLGELLLKLRLFKVRERLEALLQEAAAGELAYADFLEQVLCEEVVAKTSKNVTMRTAMARFPCVKTLESFDFAFQPSIDKKKIKELALGQVLEVVSDDEGIKKDMPAWCETTGHQMVGLEEEQAKSGRIYKAFVKKTK